MTHQETKLQVSGEVTPNLAQMMILASAEGHTTESFIETIVNKILNRIGVNNTKIHEGVTNVNTTEQPIRGYRELAKAYNASPASICKLVNEGKIPVMRVGNRTLFYKSQVDKALAKL